VAAVAIAVTGGGGLLLPALVGLDRGLLVGVELLAEGVEGVLQLVAQALEAGGVVAFDGFAQAIQR
jgi:hypothetical protein